MALKSMTGYGRGEAGGDNRVWVAEVRCVNNRFLDAKVKIPKEYAAIEDRLKKIIGEFHQRGRVDLSLTITGDFSDLVEVRVNYDLAQTYKNSLDTLAQQLSLNETVSMSVLLGLPDVLVKEQRQEELTDVLPTIEEAVTEALKACSEMRLKEAEVLVRDLRDRLVNFSSVLDQVEQSIPELLRAREESLNDRLEKLLDTIAVDPMRLAQEVAILADKTDVTEELVRLRSHISQFSSMIESSGAIGRKLDFLIQEFLREVNTMASKINDAGIAHLMVGLKSELEKMKEQVQNIE